MSRWICAMSALTSFRPVSKNLSMFPAIRSASNSGQMTTPK
jgi:hypothetical protein